MEGVRDKPVGEAVKVTACYQELGGDGGEEDSKESWWDGTVRKLNKVSGVTREVCPTFLQHQRPKQDLLNKERRRRRRS